MGYKRVIVIKVCPLSSSPSHELLTVKDMLIVSVKLSAFLCSSKIRVLLLVY